MIGCSLFVLLYRRNPSFQSKTNLCIKLPISFFPFTWKPLVELEIEKKRYTFLVDTGSSHLLDLHDRVLQKVKNKKFVDIDRYVDIAGREYPVSRFLIDEMVVDYNLRLNRFEVCEENINFLINELPGNKPKNWYIKFQDWVDLFWIDGRIGWPMFKKAVCLFDFPHSAMYLAKDLNTLEQEEIFFPEHFTKMPLEPTKSGFVLIAQTEIGPKRLLLDTGSSHSIYRDFQAKSRTPILLTVNVEGHDLGKWEFIPFPFASEFSECDGILGIEFFQAHEVCLDAEGKSLYVRGVD